MLSDTSTMASLPRSSPVPGLRYRRLASRWMQSPRLSDPVNIPHDDEERGVATGGNRQRKPQVSGHLRVPPQVARTAWTTLSRWRHGFESRWDYQGKRVVGVPVSTLVKVQTRTSTCRKSPGHAGPSNAALPVSRPAFVPRTNGKRRETAVGAAPVVPIVSRPGVMTLSAL